MQHLRGHRPQGYSPERAEAVRRHHDQTGLLFAGCADNGLRRIALNQHSLRFDSFEFGPQKLIQVLLRPFQNLGGDIPAAQLICKRAGRHHYVQHYDAGVEVARQDCRLLTHARRTIGEVEIHGKNNLVDSRHGVIRRGNS